MDKNKQAKISKTAKKSFLAFGLAGAIVSVPLLVSQMAVPAFNARSVQPVSQAAVNKQNPVTPIAAQQASTITQSDFFRIYKSSTVVTSGDLSTLGVISVVKFSGLPFYEDLGVRSIRLRDSAFIDDKGAKAAVVKSFTSITANNDGTQFNDTISSSGVETVSKLNSPQAVEFNKILETPTTLRDIQLSLDITSLGSITKPWSKIGSISLLTADGTVYRTDNVNINSVIIKGSPKDGTSPNISFANLTWTRWDKGGNVDNAFMMSYDRTTINTAPQTYVTFFDGLSSRTSSTPIISGGSVSVMIINSQNNALQYIDIRQELTEIQSFNFLLEINDSGFLRSFSDAVGKDPGTLATLSPDSLEYFDVYTAKTIYTQSSKWWDLTLRFDGSASSMDRASLSNLAFLGYLQNIVKFKIYVEQSLGDVYYALNLNDLYFVRDWANVQQIVIPENESPNSSGRNNAKAIGDILSFTWLNDIPSLNLLDISGLGDYDPNADTNILLSSWKGALKKGFQFVLDDSLLRKAQSNTALKAEYNVSPDPGLDAGYNYTLLEKIIAPTFPSPTIINNPAYSDSSSNTADKYIYTTMNLNNEPVGVIMANGILYWDFRSKQIDPSKITFTTTGNNYFTDDYVAANAPDPTTQPANPDDPNSTTPTPNPFSPITPSLNYYGNIVTSQLELKNDGPLSFQNYSLLDRTIMIDGKEYGKAVYKSEMFYEFDLAKIRYVLTTNDNPQYFTSLDELFKVVPQNVLAGSSVFSITTKADSLATYREYALQDKSQFVVAEPVPYNDNNTISVNDTDYTDVLVNGLLVWNFGNDLKVENIKYVNPTTKRYYTLPFLPNILPNLASIKTHEAYPDIPQLGVVPQLGLISAPTDINKQIIVDRVPYGVTLYQGSLLWNYDISQIKYQRQYVDDKGVLQVEYYTRFSLIPQELGLGGITELKQSTQQQVSITPTNNYFTDTKTSNHLTVIDGTIYTSTIRHGLWYWGAPEDVVKNVKYVDANTSYYTDVTENNYQSPGLTQTSVNFQALPDNSEFVFPQRLSLQNLDIVNDGIDVIIGKDQDGKDQVRHLTFVVQKGLVYLSPDMRLLFNFATKTTTGDTKYYYDYAAIPANEKAFAWSIVNNDPSDEPRQSQLLVPPAQRLNITSPFDPLVLFDEQGNRKTVGIVYNSAENEYYYTDLEALKTIKFVGQYGNYFARIQPGQVNLDFDSVDIDRSKIDEYVQPLLKIDKPIEEKTKLIGRYIAGFGAAVLATAAIVWWVIKLVKRRKG